MTICRECGMWFPDSQAVLTIYREPVCSPRCREQVYEKQKTVGGMPKDWLEQTAKEGRK